MSRQSALLAKANRGSAPPQHILARLIDAYRQSDMPRVIAEGEAALEHHAPDETVYVLLGAAQLSLGRNAAAEATFRRAIADGIREPGIYSNLGMAIAGQGRNGDALEYYRVAIAADPARATAHNNLGNALKACGHLAEALAAYANAVQLDSGYADAHNNMGLVLEEAGRSHEAVTAFGRAIVINPDHAAALNNLGNVHTALGDLTEAIACYRRSLASRPNYAETLHNLGNVYRLQGRTAEAIATYAQAEVARPDYADAKVERGKTLGAEMRIEEAIAALDDALAIDPAHVGALSHRLFYKAQACDWTAFGDWQQIEPAISTQFPPFISLAFEDDPARQLARSRSWVKKHYSRAAAPSPLPQPAADGRIRIGYFSADFHDHATMYLMAGLLREHDRGQFAIHAFSYGPQSGGAMYDAMRTHVDEFHEIGHLPSGECVDRCRRVGLDIAVDLKGFTQNSRMQLFADRLAPVQISYLGYPGTSGADFIDYLIADPVVVPDAESAFFSERLLLLPDSYQPNDNERAIASTWPSRAECGLPDSGVVFCCFNQSYKIGPREFAIWMRLLQRTEGSVLWLLQCNPLAVHNLRREAAVRGVAPERLVFAEPKPHAEHLSRLRHADLFLDTFNVNAHTTASDALWAGVPVVTLAGRQFAARVCASLLQAIGLTELVTQNERDYEVLVLALAENPDRLAKVRATLGANRLTTPLFDTVGYTRNLEAAFVTVHTSRLQDEA